MFSNYVTNGLAVMANVPCPVNLTTTKWIRRILCAGLVACVVVDGFYPRDPSLTGPRGTMVLPQVMRGIMLGIMFFYVGFFFNKSDCRRFVIGQSLFFYALIVACSLIWTPISAYRAIFLFCKQLYWIFGIFVFYHLVFSGVLKIKHITLTVHIIIIIALLRSLMVTLDPSSPIERNAQQTLLLWCIPLMLLNPRSKVTVSLVYLATFSIVLTLKRGALVGLFLSVPAYLLAYGRVARHTRDFKKVALVVGMLFFVIVCVLVWQWDNVLLRWRNLTDVDTIGSGRGMWFRMILRHCADAPLLNQIFGFGFFSVLPFLDYYWVAEIIAHSDWLETLHDQGLVGVFAFLLLHLAIILYIRRGILRRAVVVAPLVMGYTVFWSLGFHSQCTMGSNTIFFALLLGYCSAVIDSTSPVYARKKMVSASIQHYIH